MSKMLTVRVEDELYSALSLAAHGAGVSREAYIRALFERKLAGSVSGDIAQRSSQLVQQVISAFNGGFIHARLSFAMIASELGFQDVTALESRLHGDVPFPFAEIDHLCHFVGASSAWVRDGRDTMFSRRARFGHKVWDFIRAIVRGEVEYKSLWFVMFEEDRGEAILIGNKTDYVYEVVLGGIPMHGDVGGGGTRDIRAFAELLVALDVMSVHQNPIVKAKSGTKVTDWQIYGRILGEQEAVAFREGGTHLAPLVSSPNLSSYWFEDFADLSKSRGHTKNYVAAKERLQSDLAASDIRTNADFRREVSELYLRAAAAG